MMHPEDEARANLYGLIARLFQAAPDSQLISQLLAAPRIEGEGELGASWREMIEACRTAFPAALESEHTDLFVGTGKSLVTPYLSYYLRRHGNDNPLV